MNDKMNYDQLIGEFTNLAGEMAESLSFNKSVGQIYGLLYLQTGASLSLEEIARRLSMSKGNASVNLRFLETWGAVRSVWVQGSRRDHYEANRNIQGIALNRLQLGLGRRLDRAEQILEKITSSVAYKEGRPEEASVRKQLKEIQNLVANGRKAIGLLPKVLGFFTK